MPPHSQFPPTAVLISSEDIFLHMTEENSTGSNAVWAIALVIIVAIIAGLVYYSGILKGGMQKKDIDINVTVPSAPAR